MVTQRKTTRKSRAEQGGERVVKEKFMEERIQSTKAKPLVALNKRQQEYIDQLKEKPVVLATGFAGTSKTYIPTVMAADLYKLGQISKIIITRPAVSSSKSVGFFKELNLKR